MSILASLVFWEKLTVDEPSSRMERPRSFKTAPGNPKVGMLAMEPVLPFGELSAATRPDVSSSRQNPMGWLLRTALA